MYSVKQGRKVIDTFKLFVDAWLCAIELPCFSVITGPDIIYTVNPPKAN